MTRRPPRHPDAEGGPRYVVSWQVDFDEWMTPQEVGIEAWRLVQQGEGYMEVLDLDTNRCWNIRFHDHELQVIETRRTRWDKVQKKFVKEPIRKWVEALNAYVEDNEE